MIDSSTIKLPEFVTINSLSKMAAAQKSINPDELYVQKKSFAQGGFADVHLVNDKMYKNYVLKIYNHKIPKLPGTEDYFSSKKIFCDNIDKLNNSNITKLSSYFVDIIIPTTHTETEWYLMSLAKGQNLQDMIDSEKVTPYDDEEFGKILIEMCEMLKHLHKNKYLFTDFSLDQVIVDKNSDIQVCDLDSIFKISELKKNIIPSNYKTIFASKENLLDIPLTKTGNLEQFALAMNYMYTGDIYIDNRLPGLTDTNIDQFEESLRSMAKKNKRVYSNQLLKQIPKNLKDVMNGLISYPRNKGITIDDIEYSLKQEFPEEFDYVQNKYQTT